MVEFECKCCNFWSSISLLFTGGGVLAYCPVKRFYFLNRCLMPQICEDTNPLLQSASMPSSAVLWTNPLESFSKIKGHTLQWQVVPTLHARSPGGRHNIYALQGHTNLPDAQIFGKGNASKWKWKNIRMSSQITNSMLPSWGVLRLKVYLKGRALQGQEVPPPLGRSPEDSSGGRHLFAICEDTLIFFYFYLGTFL